MNRYSIFEILKSSFIRGLLHFRQYSTLVSCTQLEYTIKDIPLLIFCGLLPLEVVIIISNIKFVVWSPHLKYDIWGGSNQWLLRYSTFSIWGHLPLQVIIIAKTCQFWFGPIGLSLKVEDLISGCWGIPPLLFWGRSLWSSSSFTTIFNIVLVPRLKFKRRSNMWLLRYSTLNILRSSSIGGHLHLQQFSIFVWSPRLKFKRWGRFSKWLQRYSAFNILMSSSIEGRLHCKQLSILVWYPRLKFKGGSRSNKVKIFEL